MKISKNFDFGLNCRKFSNLVKFSSKFRFWSKFSKNFDSQIFENFFLLVKIFEKF